MNHPARNCRPLLLILALVAGFALSSAPIAATGRTPDIRLLAENENEVVFEYRLPGISTDSAPGGGVFLRVDGGRLTGETGFPAAPVRPVVISLPPGAEVSVELVDARTEETDRYDVAPQPALTDSGEVAAPWDPALPGGIFPARWFEVSPPARLRDHRVVTLMLQPVRFDPSTGTTAILRGATVRVRFSGGRPAKRESPARRDPFDGIYRSTILNHRSASAWRERPSRGPRKRGDSFASSESWIRIEIEERGFYSIAHDDLVAIGVLDPSSEIGDARTLRLFTGTGLSLPEDLSTPRDGWMEETSIRVAGESDGSFDPGDRVEFYGLPPRGWIGEFDPGAESYDEHVEHPHADRNVYWLTWGGTFAGNPKRMSAVPAGEGTVPGGALTVRSFPEFLHFEEDSILDLTRFGSDGWFWRRFSSEAPSWIRSFEIVDPDTTGPASLRASFLHYETVLSSCGTEGMDTRVNGTDLGHERWDSCDRECDSVYVDDYGREICVNPHIGPHEVVRTGIGLLQGVNGIEFEASHRKGVYLDWFDVGYERLLRAREGELQFRLPVVGDARVAIAGLSAGSRVFDMTDPKDVKELVELGITGDSLVLFLSGGAPRAFHALHDSAWRKPAAIERRTVADLRSPARGGEYLIVVADEFASAVAPLAVLRSGEGTVKTVKLSEVYDQFAWGLPDPAAIRDFLAWAVRGWPEGERPSYLLLVGDATDDFKNRGETPERNILPTFYRIDPNGNGTNTFPTDDYFTYLDPDSGEGDWAPDLAVGRLPAQDAAEAASMIMKIVRYQSTPETGSWRNRLLFLADDHLRQGGVGGYDCTFLLTFTNDAERLASTAGDQHEREKIYLVEHPLSDMGLKPEAKADYLRRFAEGHLLSSYTGHGSWDKMAGEELLLIKDVRSEFLANGDRLPFFTAWSCDLGQFDGRYQDCMTEKMLKLEEGGIVGSVAATEGAFGSVSFDLARDFLGSLFPDPAGGMPAGAALAASKVLSGAFYGGRKINDEKYVLCGDPSLKLGIPENGILLSGTDTLSLRRGGVVTLRGEITDPSGAPLTSFEGVLEITVRGAADTTGFAYWDSVCVGGNLPRERRVDYVLPGPGFHRGEADVTAGVFEASFFVPLDVPAGPLGRVGLYAYTPGGREAAGGSDSIAIEVEPVGYERDDFKGPSIRLTADGTEHVTGFRSTGKTLFDVTVEDESGVAYDGVTGSYSIGLSIDGGSSVDLTPWFALDRNGYRAGKASFRLPEVSPDSLADGEHDLLLVAKDGFGNESEVSHRIDYTAGARSLAFLGGVLNYPNPFDPDRGETEFFVDLTRDADLEIRILTVTGKRIRVLDRCRAFGATRLSGCTWDGRDADGDRVANGVYLVRVIAETEDGRERAESIGKVVVRRGP
ncbi:MAG: type IX secretion system sortase PorU [Candidatus Eisenbacteria bacterium]